ncbi:unnamed protein product [Rangifer tarandus platyrhynchus]|uniref:Uncharacterized protein n=1 Tax=Rangifer tarandus platyrhynchus TaxID=3082113 RepID=A0AC59YPQ9_RANTA
MDTAAIFTPCKPSFSSPRHLGPQEEWPISSLQGTSRLSPPLPHSVEDLASGTRSLASGHERLPCRPGAGPRRRGAQGPLDGSREPFWERPGARPSPPGLGLPQQCERQSHPDPLPGGQAALFSVWNCQHTSIDRRCAQKRRIHYNRLVIRGDCRRRPWAGSTWRFPGGACSLSCSPRWGHDPPTRAGAPPHSAETPRPLRGPSPCAANCEIQTHVCRGNFWRGCWAGEPAWLVARHHQAEAGAHPRSLPGELRAVRLKAGDGEESPKPCRGSPANQATQAAEAPGDPAVSGARGLPGVSRVALGESRMTQPGSGRSPQPVGARAPQSSQAHTQTSAGAEAPRDGSRAGGGSGRGRGEAWFLRRPGLPRLPASARTTAPPTQRVGVRVGRW